MVSLRERPDARDNHPVSDWMICTAPTLGGPD